MPRRVAELSRAGLLEGANLASTIGGFVLTVAVLIFIANVILSLMDRRPAVADPWGGFTLEWATGSPPPPLNFSEPLPPITSETPRPGPADRPARRRGETVTAGWAYVVLWGVLLAILAVLHLAFDLDGLQLGLAIGAAAAVLALGALLAGTAPREASGCFPRTATRRSCSRWAP